MKFWQKWAGILVSIVFLGISTRTAFAGPAETPKPTEAACEFEGQVRKPYVRVVTQGDPLRVRATPNGPVVGALPNGWAVVPVKRDRTGEWIRVTLHYGDDDRIVKIEYPSAPDFSTGWVSAKYVENIGSFCDKPMEVSLLERSDLVAQQEILVQEDWLALGDRIAQLNAN
jgi:Bacterial SH3 domain